MRYMRLLVFFMSGDMNKVLGVWLLVVWLVSLVVIVGLEVGVLLVMMCVVVVGLRKRMFVFIVIIFKFIGIISNGFRMFFLLK